MHPDDDELAVAALGEADEATRAHLAGCQRCAAQVRELAEVVELGRLGPLVQPPPRVWDAVVEAVAEPEPDLTDPDPTEPDPTERDDVEPAGVEPDRRPVPGLGRDPVAPAEPVRGPRRRQLTQVAAAAVIAAGLGAGAVLGVQQLRAPRPVVLASAELQPLPGWDAVGSADVETDEGPDGLRELVVRLPEEQVDGFRQVWLASDDLSQLVPLGVLTGSEGTFALPADLDLAAYPVVDVSAEADDGDPGHSGVSLARGDLDG